MGPTLVFLTSVRRLWNVRPPRTLVGIRIYFSELEVSCLSSPLSTSWFEDITLTELFSSCSFPTFELQLSDQSMWVLSGLGQ